MEDKLREIKDKIKMNLGLCCYYRDTSIIETRQINTKRILCDNNKENLENEFINNSKRNIINEIVTMLVDDQEEFFKSVLRDLGIDTNKNIESIKENLERMNMKLELPEWTKIGFKRGLLKLNGVTIAEMRCYTDEGKIIRNWEKLYGSSDIDKLIKKSSEQIDECIKIDYFSCQPRCLGCYKTFLCGNENCKFTEKCEKKQAFNKVKNLVDKFNLDITEDEIREFINYKNSNL